MYRLYDHQLDIVNWMAEREAAPHHGIHGGILAVEMGLGKTLTSLHYTFNHRGQYPTLIICSKSLMPVWEAEILQFFPDVTYLMFHRDYIKNQYEYITTNDMLEYDIIISTYDITVSTCTAYKLYGLVEILGVKGIYKDKVMSYRQPPKPDVTDIKYGSHALYGIPWGRIICDESQRFANAKTKTFKSVLCLYSKYKWCLTGTPIKNEYKDIWAQLVYCGYDSPHLRGWRYRNYIQDEMPQVIYNLRLVDTYVELPELIMNVEHVELGDDQRQSYLHFLSELKEAIIAFELKEVDFSCILVAFLRLRQVCISPTLTLKDELSLVISTPKLDIIKNIVLDHPDEKILIFSMYTGCLTLIRQILANNGITAYLITGDITNMKTRFKILTDFKTHPEHNVLLMNYKIGSEGLNITEASRVICVEPWWNDAVHQQAIARAWRIGQTREVNAHFIINLNTIEIKIMELCQSKKAQANALLNMMDKMPSKTSINLTTIKKIIQ